MFLFALTCMDSTNVADAWMRKSDYSCVFAENIMLCLY